MQQEKFPPSFMDEIEDQWASLFASPVPIKASEIPLQLWGASVYLASKAFKAS